MSALRLTAALLALGSIALAATAWIGSPWPGVALCGLSLVPWSVGEWLEHVRGAKVEASAAIEERLQVVGAMIQNAIVETHRAHARIEEQGQQLNSLRSAVSVRGTLGG